MRVEYFPRKGLIEAMTEGWRLIPSHAYSPSDWAVLMWLPDAPQPLNQNLMEVIASRFAAASYARKNTSCAAQSRNWHRWGKPALSRKLEAAE